jgi:hypothetical protein
MMDEDNILVCLVLHADKLRSKNSRSRSRSTSSLCSSFGVIP